MAVRAHICFTFITEFGFIQIRFIGRLDYQKGTDVILSAIPELLQDDVQFDTVETFNPYANEGSGGGTGYVFIKTYAD
ncbi:hypothetical protein LguiB_001734 [Lonicera macranthoides]